MEPDLVVAVTDAVQPVVARAGLHCESVQVSGQGKGRRVVVVVDLPEDQLGGVDLDQIAEVTREVSTALDESDVIAGAYRLEVTTPGIGRPLTEPRHFKRARGRLAAFGLSDGTTVEGRIRAANESVVTIVTDGAERTIAYPDVQRAKVQVEFKDPPAGFLDEITTSDAGKA